MAMHASHESGAGRDRSLYEKIWDAHLVERLPDGTCIMAVDRQLIYEYTSAPAFKMLRESGRRVRRASSSLAMADHSVPTKGRDRLGGGMLRLLGEFRDECTDAGITLLELDDPRHGIVHVVGPEQGFTQPGLLMACADSHTSSHGALGALAFGVGSSELAHVLATQTLLQKPSKTLRVTVEGPLPAGVAAKDLALALIGHFGVRVGVGYAIEFAGSGVEALDMAGRLTLCNMAVEAGARSGLVAPDDVTFDWLRGRPMAPSGAQWDTAVAYWRTLRSDAGAVFDKELRFDATDLQPQVTWGTSPEQVVGIGGRVPDPSEARDEAEATRWRRACEYMDLQPGTALEDVRIDRVFIGSCTNSRLSDLQAAAEVVRGRHLAEGVHGMVVPGSGLIKRAAEEEGLDRVFVDAGFEWRDAGCSMCFASPHDSVAAGERCASTSNRNFENRQGLGGRTHLVSPAMAAAAGIAGHFVDVRALSHVRPPERNGATS
jgi:3-isopropylmalate/(R)-2-methylmalate dehydratase large subunit